MALDERDPASEARLLSLRSVICWARGDVEGCARFAEPALDLAARCGDHGALAAAYTARAMLAALHGDLPANANFYDVALRHAERAGDVAQIVRIRTNRGSRLVEQGEYARAVAELDLAITTAELAGSDTFSSLAYNNRGEAYLALGQLDLALGDLRRAHDIWTRLASDRILYPLINMGLVQLMRGQRSEAIALFNEAICIASRERDAQGLVPAYIGLANALDRDDPAGATEAARQAIEANHPLWMADAYIAAGNVACHAGDLDAAVDWAAKATELAGQRHDRPALAEALLLHANLGSSESATYALQASRLWHELGNPIGEARADLALARTTTGRRREELIDQRRTKAAGRRGVGRPRRRPPRTRRGRHVLGRHRHARRIPGEPGQRARGRQRVGVAQGARPREAARRPAGRPGRARRSHRTAVARRTRPLVTAPVGAVEHRAQRVRPAQAAESRLLRGRRQRHRVART